MGGRERIMVTEKPRQFELGKFDPEVALKFLPGWELTENDQQVTFHQKYSYTEGDERTRQIDIDLEDGSVMILELKNSDCNATVLAGLAEVTEIRMHSRFGNAFITFLNSERFLVLQPQSMEVASVPGEPIGHMLIR